MARSGRKMLEFLISSTFLQSHDQQTAVVRFYTLGGQYSSDWGRSWPPRSSLSPRSWSPSF
jgi:hypothetical protein